jgi:hypothetical protein
MQFDMNAHIASQARHDVSILDEALRGTLDGVGIVRLRMMLDGRVAREDKLDAFLERVRYGTLTKEDRDILQTLRNSTQQHGVYAEEMQRRTRAQGVRY